MEVRSLQARATNAERRLQNAQNQLLAAEERLANANQKTTAADGKWEARVKEYEARLKAAEEKVKRERQGAKETALQLENQIKCVDSIHTSKKLYSNHRAYRSLQRQKEIADRRNQQLNEIVDQYKPGSGPSK
jgi:uncharacterized protein (DUF342 family)